MELKYCYKCDSDKPIDDFHKNPSKKDGLQNMCKECRKKYHRNHYLNNKEKYIENSHKNRNLLIDWFVNEKKKLKCEKCGDDRWWVLDFHHIDPNEKDTDVSILVRNGNKERLKIEMNKCMVLCANCHRDLHYNENASIV